MAKTLLALFDCILISIISIIALAPLGLMALIVIVSNSGV